MSRIVNDRIELPTRGVAGHALRRVQKLNDTLRGTRDLVAASGETPDRSIALLLAETRVLVLHMGRHEFGHTANMHFHAVKNAETPGSHPQHESFSRVCRTWSRLAGGDGYSPLVKKQLKRSYVRLLDLLVPEKDDHGRPLRGTIDGLYRIWMYEMGHDAFESASRKTNRHRVPLSYGTLWQRRQVGMVPDFDEIRVIGTHLGCDLSHAGAIWAENKAEQLLQRGVPQPLVQFVVAIQRQYPGLRMTASSIRRHIQVSEKTAQAINNGQLVRFDEVENAIRSVMPTKQLASFRSEWTAAWDRFSSKESFATAFPRLCAANGWTNHMLATLLQVRAPEARSVRAAPIKKMTKVTRAESYRPSAEVRRMYQEISFSGQAPAMAAIELVTRDGVLEASGESQKNYLTRLFLEGVERRLSRKGSGAHGSPIRGQRILCGVTPRQLADASGYSKADILLIERGLRTVSAAETRRIVGLIQTFPARAVDEARARMVELNSPPMTIVQAVERLRIRHGGYIPLSRLLQDEADRRSNFTPGRLKRIERGEEVPPLPLLINLVTQGGTQMTSELLTDWYDRMPGYLFNHSKLRWRHPLARGFGLVIFEKWHSLRQFWEDQFQDDFSYSIVTRNFQQLNGHRSDFPWTTVSRYLNAAGVGVTDPRRNFLQQLFRCKDEITDAINSRDRRGLLAIINSILKNWRKQARAMNGDAQAIEHTLGLTLEERDGPKDRSINK